MKTPRSILLFAVMMVVIAACELAVGQGPQRPNIVFILADDLGWHDLSCYGDPVFETPHLNRFAGQGMRFTSAYAPAPICSASRASLLTGKTPARLGFEFVTKNEPGFQGVKAPLRAPPFTLDLPLAEVTIAEALGDAGYQTAFFGKWHLNRHHRRYLGWSPTHGPHFPYYHPEKGFANAPRSIGVDDGFASQTRPHSVIRSGPWKLIHFYEDDRDELYHLTSNSAERTDRHHSDMAVAARLRRSLDAALSAANARLPKSNPHWERQ